MRFYLTLTSSALIIVNSIMLPVSALAGGVGGCLFHGKCDVVWKANRAFDDGLRSKADSMVGPFKSAYFDIANDFFDTRWKPMIQDLTGLERGADSVVNNVRITMLETLDKTKNIVETAKGDAKEILDNVKELVETTSAKIDQEIDKIDCVGNSIAEKGDEVAKDIYGHFIFEAAVGLTESCNWNKDYIRSIRGDERPTYEAAKCILKKKLEASETVDEVIENYSRLAGVSHYYICKFRGQPGEGDARHDMAEFARAHAVWTLALGK